MLVLTVHPQIMTFAYFSTEWDMDQPFACLCGASQCLGTIRGAKDIPAEVLGRWVSLAPCCLSDLR